MMPVKDVLEDGKLKGDHDLDGQPTGDSPGQKTGTDDLASEKTFTQEDLDKILGERLARAKKSWQQDLDLQKKQDREKQKAERLAEEGKWKDLATEYTAKFESLQPKVQQYETIINDVLASQKQGLPDGVLELLESQDPADQLSWLTKYKENLRSLNAPEDQKGQPPRLTKFNPQVPEGDPKDPFKGMNDLEIVQKLQQDRGKGIWKTSI